MDNKFIKLDRMLQESSSDYALRCIRYNIIDLNLKPGEKVSESELSKMIGVSKTPVRQALLELSNIRIVDILPQSGSYISLIDFDLIDEAMFLRRSTERNIAEDMAINHINISSLKQNLAMQKFYIENEDLRIPEMYDSFTKLDDEFHHLMYSLSKKSTILDYIDSFYIHVNRVRNSVRPQFTWENIFNDHENIMNAILQGDGGAASKAVDIHLHRYNYVEIAKNEMDQSYIK